jgi:type 1 glutamine amidotransferase
MSASILLISAGIHHPSPAARTCLHRILLSLPAYRIERAHTMESLSQIDLSLFRTLVLYFHHKSMSPAALRLFENYVENGGGVLALHSAAASFMEVPRYFEILGGRFSHHGPIEEFEVRSNGADDAIYSNIPSFTVYDELYRHEYNPDNHVHFTTPVDGMDEPVVWTRNYGKGKVCYFSLGHTESTWEQPSVKSIIERSLHWLMLDQVFE